MDPAAIVMVVATGTVAVFSIPIVWMLTVHQRKMAAIIHGSQRENAAANSDALTSEVRELKQLVFQQAIALDSLATEVRKLSQLHPRRNLFRFDWVKNLARPDKNPCL